MTLSTTHIGFAIKTLMEDKWIEGEKPSHENPFADDSYLIEHVDISDANNPWLHTTGGTFKIIILKMDPPVKLTRITEEGN
jgi:hypothetical protein